MAYNAHCFQDTFWNNKRVESGIKLDDLAEQFHVSNSCVSTWFTGQIMPTDHIIHQLCELFDVDYNIGHSEFFKAHQAYVAKKRVGTKAINRSHNTSLSIPNNIDIYEAVYGKLSYDEFRAYIEACANKNVEEAVKYIYGKVDYDVFLNIINLLKGANDAV